MTEYQQSVLALYAAGLSAWEISKNLNKTANQIHQMISYLRKKGLIVMKPGESDIRRSINRSRAIKNF